MSQDQITHPSMYCRQCGYALHGLSEDRCPECGKRFDPADPRTYHRHPHQWQRKWRFVPAVTAFAGLISWPASLLIFGLMAGSDGRGPDGGWVMMAAMFKSLGVIVLVHLAGMAGILMLAIWQVLHKGMERTVAIGLVYYSLVMIVFLWLKGPQELVKDSIVTVQALFRH